jgi:hypothetical protein
VALLRRHSRLAFLLFSAAVALFLAVTQCNLFGGREMLYLRGNTKILNEVPEFPGAQVIERQTNQYCASDAHEPMFCFPQRWSSRVYYRLPAEASPADVKEFYESQLDPSEWERGVINIPVTGVVGPPGAGARTEFIPDGLTVLLFCQDDAVVSVEMSLRAPPGAGYSVAVDHDQGKRCQ